MRAVGLLAAAALAWGCNNKVYECSEDVPCGFGEECIEGLCKAGSCSSSDQCPIESHCDDRKCVQGCAENSDCLPGYECNTDNAACETKFCEDSHVDCGYREFCNALTGECYDAGGQYCKPCDADNQVADCGEENYCLNGYCGVNCSEGQECPAGFECMPIGDGWGNIISWQCFTYCWLFEDYDPGSFVTEAAPDLGVLECNP